MAIASAPSGAGGAAARRQLAAALLAETNRIRREHGRPPLRPARELDAAADDHAALMVMVTGLSHLSPIRGQRTPGDRVRRHGFDAAMLAENIAAYPIGDGQAPPSAAEIAAVLVEQWVSSPGHRANLLSPHFTQLGGAVRVARVLGRAWYAYGVQLFAVPRNRSALGS